MRHFFHKKIKINNLRFCNLIVALIIFLKKRFLFKNVMQCKFKQLSSFALLTQFEHKNKAFQKYIFFGSCSEHFMLQQKKTVKKS